MVRCFPARNFPLISLCLLILFSCGGEGLPEAIIESYESGNKKVFARFYPETNVYERHFFNQAGEIFYLEWDTLSIADDFREFMQGTWIIDKMTVDDEIVFEKDSVFNHQNQPNIYTFSYRKLVISGPQYSADYDIQYLDSTQIALDGKWTYGVKGENSYRYGRLWGETRHFQILSYYNIIWTNFLNDPNKEEEVIFRRITIPSLPEESLPDTSILPDTTISSHTTFKQLKEAE